MSSKRQRRHKLSRKSEEDGRPASRRIMRIGV
jgi:hypothetical protein